jgi:hypothetical protein
MRQTITVLILLAVCFSLPGFSGDDKCAVSAQSIPICNVIADASKYDGKEITVRGLYRMLIHGSILMGTACPKDNINLRKAPNAKEDKHALAEIRSFYKKKENRFQPIDEVLRGTFRVAQQGQCFGQDCWSYEIEVTELFCAAPKKADAPDAK